MMLLAMMPCGGNPAMIVANDVVHYFIISLILERSLE